jgi:TPR repeat protein
MFGFGTLARIVVTDLSLATGSGRSAVASFASSVTTNPVTSSRVGKYVWASALSLCAVFMTLSSSSSVYGQSGWPSPHQGADAFVPSKSDLNAAAEGNVQAQLAVAKAYNSGIPESTNYTNAFEWFQAASEQGNLEARAWLGSLYLFGTGVPQDVNRALQLIQPAADSNDPVGLRFLGLMFQNGQGVVQDYAKAFQLYSKATSLGDANAFDRLGLLYFRGLGVNRNMLEALRLFTEGASLGDSWAQFHLGQMYEKGRVRPDHTLAPLGPDNAKITPNYAMALKLYVQSAAHGNRVAAYKAGAMYEAGSGTPQNYKQALEYYKRSAESKQYAPALVALGRFHELGLGTSVDLPYAYVAYSVAARQEDAEASNRLRALTRRLTPEQLASAKGMLQRFWDFTDTEQPE